MGVENTATKSGWDSLRRHLRFLPHERRLLTTSADFWFFSARVLVFVMAAAEAVAWGYLGFLFGDGISRWVGAALVGLSIFLVVWMIDVSLITMDRSWSEHSAAILGDLPSSLYRARKDRVKPLRDFFTFALRVGLLIASLSITAPYLAQVVFHKDIQQIIDSQATATIDATRQSIAQSYDSKISENNTAIGSERSALEHEVAGTGLSGRYGMGPAAQAIRAELRKLEDKRDSLAIQKKDALQKYDNLAHNWRNNRNDLAALYKIDLPQTSILENRKALDEIRKRPENQSTELAIKAFLAFIFAGLLLLKLFEPSSVKLYLSDVLQQEYDRYLAGTFDKALPEVETARVGRFNMSPQRLYDFLVRDWIPARRNEENDLESLTRKRVTEKSLESLDSIRRDLEKEYELINVKYEDSRNRKVIAAQDLQELLSAIGLVQADINDFTSRLKPERHPNSGVNQEMPKDDESRLEYELHRLNTQSAWKEDLAAAHLALSKLSTQQPAISQALEHASAEHDILGAKRKAKQEELIDIANKIRQLRERHSDSVEDQARTVLSSNKGKYRNFTQGA